MSVLGFIGDIGLRFFSLGCSGFLLVVSAPSVAPTVPTVPAAPFRLPFRSLPQTLECSIRAWEMKTRGAHSVDDALEVWGNIATTDRLVWAGCWGS